MGRSTPGYLLLGALLAGVVLARPSPSGACRIANYGYPNPSTIDRGVTGDSPLAPNVLSVRASVPRPKDEPGCACDEQPQFGCAQTTYSVRVSSLGARHVRIEAPEVVLYFELTADPEIDGAHHFIIAQVDYDRLGGPGTPLELTVLDEDGNRSPSVPIELD